MEQKIITFSKKFTQIASRYAGVISIAALCFVCYFLPMEAFSISAQSMLDWQLWRILLALFMHNGPVHIFINMLALLLVGSYLERRYGTALFLAIYLSGGLLVNASGGIYLILCRSSGTIEGASTGIYSALGVLMALTLNDRRGTINDFSLANMCIALLYLVGADIVPASTTAFIGHTLALGFGMLAAFIYIFRSPLHVGGGMSQHIYLVGKQHTKSKMTIRA